MTFRKSSKKCRISTNKCKMKRSNKEDLKNKYTKTKWTTYKTKIRNSFCQIIRNLWKRNQKKGIQIWM